MSNAFPVDISETQTISHFKDTIKEKKKKMHSAIIDASELKLWKVHLYMQFLDVSFY